MSEGEKPKLTGIAAIGAAFAALMLKGGMACGGAISHLAKPATHVAEDAARHVAPGAIKAAEEGGVALVDEAGHAAARRAAQMGGTTDRIVDSGTALARGEIRRRARDERENRKEAEKKRVNETRTPASR